MDEQKAIEVEIVDGPNPATPEETKEVTEVELPAVNQE